MKPEIIARIQQLGGTTDRVRGRYLLEDLQAITFRTVLYPRPQATPWAAAAAEEPIYGLNNFVDENRELLAADPAAFYQQVTDHFYQLTEEPRGQTFFRHDLFTPFKAGTADYDEWNQDFTDPDEVDLSAVYRVMGSEEPDFVCIAYSYGFPDTFYVCLADPCPDNPTVFGTDHEVFFREVTNEGSLEAFFQRFMTPDELLEILRRFLEK